MVRFLEIFLDQHALRWGLLYTLALIAGIIWYLELPSEPNLTISILVLLFLGIVQRFNLIRRYFLPSLILTVLIFFAVGICIISIRTMLVSSPVLQHEIGPVVIEGKLIQVEQGSKGNRLKIEVGAISNIAASDTPKYVRVTQRKQTLLSPGRLIKCSAFLSPPPSPIIPGDFNFKRQAYFQQLGGVGFVLGSCKPIASSNLDVSNIFNRLESKIGATRRALALYINELVGDKAGGIAAAMITGERSLLSESDQEVLRSVGLAHLLAISGLHMGLVAGVFFFIIRTSFPFLEALTLRIPTQKIAAIGAILGATGYLVLSGGSVATQRAYVMALVALIAIIIDRPAFSMRGVLIAMFVVIFLQPESVVTPGFQMSFAATAAIIAVYENWPMRRHNSRFAKIKEWVSSLVATSVTATFATAPFAAYHFERIAPLSIPANLVVMPIISLITAPSAAFAFITWPIGMHQHFLTIYGVSLEWVLSISTYFSNISGSDNIGIVPPFTFLLLTVSLCLAICLSGKFKLISLLPLCAALFLFRTQPIILSHVDKNLVVYLSHEEGWMRVLPIGLKKKPLVPLSMKEMTTDKNFRELKGDYLHKETSFTASMTSKDCKANLSHPSIIYLRIWNSSHNLCVELTKDAVVGGISISDSNGELIITHHRNTQIEKRPWS